MTTTTNEASRCPSAILSWIPWYPDGLDVEQQGAVEAHAAACRECRREIALLRNLEPGSIEAPDPERVYAKVLARIESSQTDDRTDPVADEALGSDVEPLVDGRVEGAESASGRGEASWPLALAASLVAALLVGSAVGAWFIARPREPIYHTAAGPGEPVQAASSIDVVFRDDVDMTRVNETLRAMGAQITAGPSQTGTYRVALKEDADSAAAAKLLQGGHDGVAIYAEPSLPR